MSDTFKWLDILYQPPKKGERFIACYEDHTFMAYRSKITGDYFYDNPTDEFPYVECRVDLWLPIDVLYSFEGLI